MAITLKNSAAANALFELHRTEGSRSEYRGPDHTDMKTDSVILSASAPKKTMSSFGNRRSVAKYLRTAATTLPDGTSQDKDMKAELSVSIPVGATQADVDQLVAYIRSLVNTDEVMIELVGSGKLQF